MKINYLEIKQRDASRWDIRIMDQPQTPRVILTFASYDSMMAVYSSFDVGCNN